MKERPSNSTIEPNHLSQNIAYALPTLALFMLIAPLNVMPGIYVKYFGLSLGAIALVQLLGPLVDAITDPIIGYCSDRFKQRFGTLKPLIIAGAVLVLVSSTMLYIPYGWDGQDSDPVSFTYLIVFYLSFILAWTLMDIPQLAWGAEISNDTKGRSQRFSYRTMAIKSGMLLSFSIPLLPFFDSSEITPDTLKFCVYVSWVLMALFLWGCMQWVPDAESGYRQENLAPQYLAKKQLSKKQQFHEVARVVLGNRPLLICYTAYTLIGLGLTMSSGLTFFFVDNYLGLAETLPYAFIVNYGVGLIAAWCWGLLAQKIGARVTWLVGMLLGLLGFLGIGFLAPGEASLWPYLFCKALIGAGHASTFVASYIVLASIADYGKWKFDQECSAIYFALSKTIFKFNTSVGIAMGLMLAQWLGFDPKAEAMSEAASMALRVAYVGVPAVLFIVAMIVIARIPLSTHHQSVIRKRLETRTLRASH